MKLNKLVLPAAWCLLTGNVIMAQIMPWENRTETDGDPSAKSEKVETRGKLYLEDVLSGKLIQTKGIGAMNWMKDGDVTAAWKETKKTAEWMSSPTAPKTMPAK